MRQPRWLLLLTGYWWHLAVLVLLRCWKFQPWTWQPVCCPCWCLCWRLCLLLRPELQQPPCNFMHSSMLW
jgi:hypothetical protein